MKQNVSQLPYLGSLLVPFGIFSNIESSMSCLFEIKAHSLSPGQVDNAISEVL